MTPRSSLTSQLIVQTATIFLLMLALSSPLPAIAGGATEPLVSGDVIFAERDGVISLEAEHFVKQEKAQTRAWHIVSSARVPEVTSDADGPHLEGASGGAYIEALPDDRTTHADKLIKDVNFTDVPGAMAVLTYRINVENPGRFYVWGRSHSTGSEDNGFHVGLDGEWPESGSRWQTVKKHSWSWDCKQRTQKVHTGVPLALYLDIETPGLHEVHISMREDGAELDKLVLSRHQQSPEGLGPEVVALQGQLPKAFAFISAANLKTASSELTIEAADFSLEGTGYYLDKGKWLAINPAKHQSATAVMAFPYPTGKYDMTIQTVGEEDGQSKYQVLVNDVRVGEFEAPLAGAAFVEGPTYNKTWKSIDVGQGDFIKISSQIASKDGTEYSRARVAKIVFTPADSATAEAISTAVAQSSARKNSNSSPLVDPRQPDGNMSSAVSGDLQLWHKVTVDFQGPFAHELDQDPNPFTDIRVSVRFNHAGSGTSLVVPAYFAADGRASETGASSGTTWRAHLSPGQTGEWTYQVYLEQGKLSALSTDAPRNEVPSAGGRFVVTASDKLRPDLRALGRLQYNKTRYLRFAGSDEIFLKAGPDSPETLLAYVDFDNTVAGNPKKAPLHRYAPHLQDWKSGDPMWLDGKGKGLIGAVNYLSQQGMNSISFLPYNAGGDGDNVWPFVSRNEKLHYDCSKLDQWSIVFDHATAKGLFLHFKLQENEIDDNRRGQKSEQGDVPESLDGGKLGVERKLYCRELIARFAHVLALNWNIGEENTQSTSEIIDMARYLHEVDPYDHLIVIHTFPNQQDKVYTPLLGKDSYLTGASLQNSWKVAHERTLHWIEMSQTAGHPWVVSNDEQGPANQGVPVDAGYNGHDGNARENEKIYTANDIRQETLWGTLLAGGTGVEYYFGYQQPENDLVCEDFRSRESSWKYARHALSFFRDHQIPLASMNNHDELLSASKGSGPQYCLAQPGQIYLAFFGEASSASLNLEGAQGLFEVRWFNPREGGDLQIGSTSSVRGGQTVSLGNPPKDEDRDWLVIVRKARN